MTNDNLIPVVQDVWFAKEAQAILVAPSKTITYFDEKKLNPETIGDYQVAPWGVENLLPQRVMDKIERVEVVGTNANFN